jgi:hypothetical protein
MRPVTARALPPSFFHAGFASCVGRRAARWAAALTGVAAVAGCGPKITNTNIDALVRQFNESERSGGYISPKEVESVLGPPTRVERFEMEIQTRRPVIEGLRYAYEQNGQKIEFHFLENKLIHRPMQWGEAEAKNAGREDEKP